MSEPRVEPASPRRRSDWVGQQHNGARRKVCENGREFDSGLNLGVKGDRPRRLKVFWPEMSLNAMGTSGGTCLHRKSKFSLGHFM